MHSFTISPDDYNSTIQETIDQAKSLGMTYEIIKPSFLHSIFKSSNSQISKSPKIRIHPHGFTTEERTHSLMLFFHFLGRSKAIHHTTQSPSNE